MKINNKMKKAVDKYGINSFEYFEAGCDCFDRKELLIRLFETTTECIKLNNIINELKK